MSQDLSTPQTATGKVVEMLESLLADEHLLMLHTRSAHWNVEGSDFYQMHKFFEDQYGQIDVLIDDIAERIRMQGAYTMASYEKYVRLSQLKRMDIVTYDSTSFLRELMGDHNKIIDTLRIGIRCVADEFQQPGTADFLTGVLNRHEKMAWMIRSHLKRNS